MAKKELSKPFYTQTWFKVVAVIVVLLLFAGLWLMGTYNSLVSLEQGVAAKWAQVETQYQRRADLIPNLVNTVSEYEEFEKDLLTEITSLRSQWAAARNVEEQIEVGTRMDSAISRLLLVYENYPELQTITAIITLMDELAGTENRVAVERMRYNDAVRGYNTKTKVFPASIVANMYGFTAKPYFEASEGAQDAPIVFPQ